MFFSRLLIFATWILLSTAAVSQTVPHTFSPGSIIRANEINENFKALSQSNPGVGLDVSIDGASIGRILSISWESIFLQSTTGYVFYLSFDSSGGIGFGGILDGDYLGSGLYYERQTCDGQPYVRTDWDRGVFTKIRNGIVFSNGKTLLMKRKGEASKTLSSPPQSVLTGTPLSGYSCMSLSASSPFIGYASAKYVPVYVNDPSVSGISNAVKAGGSVGEVQIGIP
jgi:hypothetical protein